MTETDDPPRPEGWYPDPFERRPLRWWDGATWTAYAGDGTDVQWDPEPVETSPVAEPGLPGLATAMVGFGVGVGLAIVGRLVHLAADEPGGRAAALAISSLGLWSGIVGACIVVSRRRGSGSLVRDYAFRFRWIDLGFGLGGSIAGRLVSGMLLAPIIAVQSDKLSDVDRSMFEDATDGTAAWIVLIVVTCVGAPLVEELYFRGLVQVRLVERHGAAVGITAASLLFGAAHLIGWEGPLSLAYAWAIAGGGLVLGLMRHLSGRLGPAIVAHAFFNAQAMTIVALTS